MSGCNLNGVLSIGTGVENGALTLSVNKPVSEIQIDINKLIGSMFVSLDMPVSLKSISVSQIAGELSICVPNVDSIRVVWYVYGTNVVTIDNKFFGYVIFK